MHPLTREGNCPGSAQISDDASAGIARCRLLGFFLTKFLAHQSVHFATPPGARANRLCFCKSEIETQSRNRNPGKNAFHEFAPRVQLRTPFRQPFINHLVAGLATTPSANYETFAGSPKSSSEPALNILV